LTRISLVALLALAACGDTGQPESTQQNAEAPTPAPAAAPAPKQADLPPPPRYVGRWAESRDVCLTEWWRFWNDEVRTAKPDMLCTILPPDATSGDTDLRVICQSGGKVAREKWELTYPETGRMTLARDGGASISLLKCR
jgi:hypothetical protein